MRTMKETKFNPEIRVYPQTRQKLKVLAAQRGMTMIELVEWLVNQEIERKGEKPREKSV